MSVRKISLFNYFKGASLSQFFLKSLIINQKMIKNKLKTVKNVFLKDKNKGLIFKSV